MKYPFRKQALWAVLALLWCTGSIPAQKTVDIKILAVNDLHGQITTGLMVSNRPVGGAAILASYLESALQGWEGRCFLVEGGDLIGASQPQSALLQDEPVIMFMNYLSWKLPVIGAAGNHEFDRGLPQLKRLLNGDIHMSGLSIWNPWGGANFPVLCANMIDSATTFPVLPPFAIKTVSGIDVKVAFIGVTLKETPSMVYRTSVQGAAFLDEVKTVNYYVSMLREALGIHAFVVLLHQGGNQPPYNGWTDTLEPPPSADIVDMVSGFDDDVDVICTAHTHTFTNAMVKNKNGCPMLLTQAYPKGTAYAEIVCTVDKDSRDIIAKKARIVTVWDDEGPGLAPDPIIASEVDSCKNKVLYLTGRTIGSAKEAIHKGQNNAGESALGDLVVDAQRAAMRTDFAMMNPGGIRGGLAAGEITWGSLFNVLPFGDYLVKMELTGQQIFDVLNQQWVGQSKPKMLETSGLTYIWDNKLPVGSRIVDIRKDGVPIDQSATYSVTVNSFLAQGGDNFTVLRSGQNVVSGPTELDALATYIQSKPQPITCSTEARAIRRN